MSDYYPTENAISAADLMREWARLQAIERTARAFLDRIDNITTEDFRYGRERGEREALRAALKQAGGSST